MINTIDNSIDQVSAEVLRIGAVVLNQVKACFLTIFIVAMQLNKQWILIGFDPLIHLTQF